jgi:hypothetical protein
MNNKRTGAQEWANWISRTRSLTHAERRAAHAWFMDTYGATVYFFLFGRAA